MKRSVYYRPLTIAVLFGLAITLIASPVVYGDSVALCQGSGSSSTSVILGGRVITPSMILRTANGQPCAANESGLNILSLTRTVVVSPNGTATQNGTALLSAMTTISNSNPSASNPWLLKLEPGSYDLGSSALMLKSYVDLEGSGEGTTIISSTVGTSNGPPTLGTVIAASNTEIRFLKIANAGSLQYQAAVNIPSSASNVRLTHLTAVSSSGSGFTYGLFNAGNPTTVQNSTFIASGGSSNFSVSNYNGGITIQNSTITASGGSYNEGMANLGLAKVQNSTFTVSGGTNSYGIYNLGTLTVQNTILSASGSPSSYGLYASANGVSVQVGASQISGSSGSVTGTVTCVASYNANFVALNASCV